MNAKVQKPLGDIQGVNPVGLLLFRGEDKLVHAQAVVLQVVYLFEPGLNIVGIEDGVLADLFQAPGPHQADIGVSLDVDAKVAVKAVNLADGFGAVKVQAVKAFFLDHPGCGQVGDELGLYPHRARARTAPAVRSGEGLVQVEVDHVKAGVPRPHLAQDGVGVGPVVV